MPIKPFILLSALLAATIPVQAQTRFPFVLPWNDAKKTVTDLSDLNPAPLLDKHRIAVKNGHFADRSGRRVRFLGTNIVASAAFPKTEDAAPVAARLHKYGFNIIRLHHMDSSWPNPNIFGADDARNTAKTEVSPQSMASLDNLVAELKKQGIYVNLNLHVGRALTAADGFENTEKLPEMGKVLAYFEPRFIEIQKDFARQILSHTNPRTKLQWAKDPAVAVVELNNEDTLVGQAWSGTLQALPNSYRETLRTGWNAFLKKRHGTNAELLRVWNAQAAPDGANLLANARFEGDKTGWNLEDQISGAQLSFRAIEATETAPPETAPQGRAARVGISQKPDANWKIQFQQTALDLAPEAFYTLSFWARADAPRTLPIGFSLDQAPWSLVAGLAPAQLGPQWQHVRRVFRVGSTLPHHSRLSLALGDDTTPVEVADFRLSPGASVSLDAAQNLDGGSIDLPSLNGAVPAQGRDWMDYLSSLEKSYVSTMRSFIKNDLGYTGLIACSQADYGGFAGLAREDVSDWIDMHAYWQHPNFPGKPWDGSDWNIPNTPMLDDVGGGTLGSLAPYRVAGKPFTVSEYNHSAPSEYASESVPLILGFAAAQDWDGIYLFDYNGDGSSWDPGRIRGYFSIDSDPNKMALFPTMARAFLGGQIAPFTSKTTLKVPREQFSPLMANSFGQGQWSMSGGVGAQWRKAGLTRRDMLSSRLEVQLVDGDGALKLSRSGARPTLAGSPSFGWNFTGKDGQLVIDTPQTKALVGRVGDAWSEGSWPLGALHIDKPGSSNGWAAITVTSRDNQPLERSASMLISALNRAENTGMIWNETRTSVSNNWGTGPIQLETPSATLRLQTTAKSAKVWKLDPTGARRGELASTLKNGELSFQIGPIDATPWYEIAATMPAAPKSKPKSK